MQCIQKLNGDYKNGAVTLAFLGDSVTQGCFESGVSMHSCFDFQAVYHNQLKQMLHLLFPTIPLNIINAGIGGETAADAVRRLDHDVLSKTPDLTVVCFGLNDIHDSLDTYLRALDTLFDTLYASGSEVIFMTPNMLNTYVSPLISGDALREIAEQTAQFQTQGRMDRYIASAIACAQKHRLPVADCYARWKTMQKCGIDTTALLANHINHPNRELHKLFAHTLLQVMLEA